MVYNSDGFNAQPEVGERVANIAVFAAAEKRSMQNVRQNIFINVRLGC